MIGISVLVLVVLGLAVTARVQVRPLRRHRALLDSLAVFPEWRFYAQASIAAAGDLARDTHIVARDRTAAGRIGGWTPVLWPVERGLRHALWNPAGQVDTLLLSIAEDLALGHRGTPGPDVQQSIGYLAVLRRVLEAPRDPDAADRQFAIVHAIGRGERRLSIDFLSAWHR